MEIELTLDDDDPKYLACSKCGNLRNADEIETSRFDDVLLCNECYDDEDRCEYCNLHRSELEAKEKILAPIDVGMETLLICNDCHFKYFY